MLKEISDRPGIDKLERFLSSLLEEKGEELEFIVLFGSIARGNWTYESDYDLLIGLCGEDQRRLIHRADEYSPDVGLDVEAFVYSRSEWQRMFETFHLRLLEALEYGVVLWDRGAFAAMKERFCRWRERGQVKPWHFGWKIEFGDSDCEL